LPTAGSRLQSGGHGRIRVKPGHDGALAMLKGKRVEMPSRKHDNLPV
jgi:hypothetical protein